MTTAPAGSERDAEIERLRGRLKEAEDVLSAIRDGTVGAITVTGDDGAQVRATDDASPRLTETMSEGVATVAADRTVLTCNAYLATLLGRPLEQVLDSDLRDFLQPTEWPLIDALLARARTAPSREEVSLLAENGRLVPVYLSASQMPDDVSTPTFCVVLTDLTGKKHHERMVADERLAQLILEQAAEAVIVCDAETRIIRLSRTALPLCADSPVGRPFAEAFPLQTESGLFRLGPVLQQEVLKSVDVTLDCEGRAYDLILNAGPLIREHETLGCVITLTDITGRKQAAAASALFRSLLDQAGDTILVIDPETGRFLDINERACLTLGYSRADFLALCVWDIDPMVSPATWPVIVANAERCGSLIWQSVHRRRVGSTFPVELNVKYVRHDRVYLVATARDITERKHAEEALRYQKTLLEVQNEVTIDGILVVDGQGRVVSHNRRFVELWGIPEGLASAGDDQPMLDWVTGQQADPTAFRERVAHLYGHPELTSRDELTLTDGRTIDRYTASVVGQDGTSYGRLWVFRDISERKLAEVQLRESNRQLEAALAQVQQTQQRLVQQESLRALGQMASGLAHDFNNALSPILGFSELLLNDPRRLADTAKVAACLRIIHTSGSDAANVVRRMREFGRTRGPGDDAAPVDLVVVVGQTIDLTRPRWKNQAQAAGKTVLIETHLGAVPMIMGEEPSLREMLTNLVFNAVDAMPFGGTIRLSTEAAAEQAVLRVSDTGTGMTAEVRQHCLEPFFSTKGDHGTGLGLSMVYGIVRRHGGTVEIDSALGRGTTFTIRFPGPHAVAIPPTDVDAPKPQTPLRLLIVDDDAMVLEILAAFLEEDGHHVETAVDGAEARLKFTSQRFDAVISDMAMPGMSGAQLAAALHEVAPGLPVILLTGFGDLMNAAGELPAGVSMVLGKPFTQAGLRKALAQVMRSA